jgi:hypothetical protein
MIGLIAALPASQGQWGWSIGIGPIFAEVAALLLIG